jgi:hypothetical protein
MLAIDTRPSRGRRLPSDCKELFGLNIHPSIAKGAVPLVLELFPPRTGRAGDARPAGLLARQLCGGSFRSARALSEASLAGGSGERDADPAREAAGDIGDFCLAPILRREVKSPPLTLHSPFSPSF